MKSLCWLAECLWGILDNYFSVKEKRESPSSRICLRGALALFCLVFLLWVSTSSSLSLLDSLGAHHSSYMRLVTCAAFMTYLWPCLLVDLYLKMVERKQSSLDFEMNDLSLNVSLMLIAERSREVSCARKNGHHGSRKYEPLYGGISDVDQLSSGTGRLVGRVNARNTFSSNRPSEFPDLPIRTLLCILFSQKSGCLFPMWWSQSLKLRLLPSSSSLFFSPTMLFYQGIHRALNLPFDVLISDHRRFTLSLNPAQIFSVNENNRTFSWKPG